MDERYHYRFREPYASPEDGGSPPPRYRQETVDGMLVERDLAVPMRDGVRIRVDVYRPDTADIKVPPLIAWSPYGKHSPTKYEYFPGCGVTSKDVSPYAAFEGPDPLYWVPRGYAVINVDPRGTWHSEGSATFLSPEEAQDFYDLIEWAGTQPWSNGKVGLTGVSYLAIAQWRVAELQPPHLAAINPWEGWTDTYREVVRHGGIPETWFWPYLQQFMGFSTVQVEDLIAETAEHPLYDAFWESKAAHPERITVPAFVVASWTDQGMHLRGTIAGFERLGSREKWLDVHGRMKWAYYYADESKQRLQDFFDHFLKGLETGVTSWPRVRLEVRERYFVGKIVEGDDWPLPETRYSKLYLDAGQGTLRPEPSGQTSTFSYHSLGGGPGPHRATFVYTFPDPIEVVGHMKLRLFMSAEDSDDLDVFVGVFKRDTQGNFVYFPHYQIHDDGPVALGWIRASHRELDEAASTEFRPVLSHRRERTVQRGEVVELNIEIWPSGTHFDQGEQLVLVVQGTDINRYPKDVLYARHEESVNRGLHRLHTGGPHDSHLLLPLVAARPSRSTPASSVG
ncbi:MAG TPA: CocE/NonD family hydrolase [Candidatus Dormibacteraeota bacterium]|nr:CocE/NonD family hydrolase [Candidatus Dormibacteraeota bacterium]